MSEFLHLFVQNALEENAEELVPRLARAAVARADALAVCANYRLAAIGMMFLACDRAFFQRRLRQSGRAWAHFLSRPAAGDRRGSDAAGPLLDAIAANDLDGAAEIARAMPRAWDQDSEYEEDFLFPEFLAQRFFLGADDAACTALLDRWERALQGTEDARLDVCRALQAKDARAFDAGLARFLSERRDAFARRARDGAVSREVLATEAKLSVEGLALVALAERRGLPTEKEYPGVPSTARGLPAVPGRPDEWRAADPF